MLIALGGMFNVDYFGCRVPSPSISATLSYKPRDHYLSLQQHQTKRRSSRGPKCFKTFESRRLEPGTFYNPLRIGCSRYRRFARLFQAVAISVLPLRDHHRDPWWRRVAESQPCLSMNSFVLFHLPGSDFFISTAYPSMLKVTSGIVKALRCSTVISSRNHAHFSRRTFGVIFWSRC
ncbi:hypothetical protein BT69DRAFT_761427 [Atractiella rhizophila]|nr:hypothetical protein BT69DRAFT_761427 [Atractiella rhizophila]